MTRTVRRAGAFALVGALSLATPVAGPATAVPFALVAALAVLVDDGPLFELFARPGDHEAGGLYGLAAFALAAAGLALFVALFGMPPAAFVASVLVLSGGNLAQAAANHVRPQPSVATSAFVVGGTLAGVAGQLAVEPLGTPAPPVALAVFVAASGALAGALLRAVLFTRDDPVVLFSVGLLSWLFVALPVSVSNAGVAAALALAGGFGVLASALDTATLSGALTGVFVGALTAVLGGLGWFALLIAFFVLGGLAAKFRYERKRRRGIAQDDGGARASGNVLANAAVALGGTVAFAASPLFAVDATVFKFVFAGSLAAAMADTLSSEVGGLYDTPRLVTTLEPVQPGTDGGVTWQGVLAGCCGAALVASLAHVVLALSVAGALVVAAAGVVGMFVDSLLGATVESRPLAGAVATVAEYAAGSSVEHWRFDNKTVNFLATLTAAAVCAVLAVGAGLAPP